MSVQRMMMTVYLGPETNVITIVASKFGVVSFLSVQGRCCFKEIIPSLEVKISNNPSSLHAHNLQFTLLEGAMQLL